MTRKARFLISRKFRGRGVENSQECVTLREKFCGEIIANIEKAGDLEGAIAMTSTQLSSELGTKKNRKIFEQAASIVATKHH